jgi:hypothetical protein
MEYYNRFISREKWVGGVMTVVGSVVTYSLWAFYAFVQQLWISSDFLSKSTTPSPLTLARYNRYIDAIPYVAAGGFALAALTYGLHRWVVQNGRIGFPQLYQMAIAQIVRENLNKIDTKTGRKVQQRQVERSLTATEDSLQIARSSATNQAISIDDARRFQQENKDLGVANLSIAQAAEARAQSSYLIGISRSMQEQEKFKPEDLVIFIMQNVARDRISWPVAQLYFQALNFDQVISYDVLAKMLNLQPRFGQNSIEALTRDEALAGPWKYLRYSTEKIQQVAVIESDRLSLGGRDLVPQGTGNFSGALRRDQVNGSEGMQTRSAEDTLGGNEKLRNNSGCNPLGSDGITQTSGRLFDDPISAADYKTPDQKKAIEVFQNMMAKNNFLCVGNNNENYTFNSYQTIWLYRWMGASCNLWLQSNQPKIRKLGDVGLEEKTTIFNFATTLCRQRFIFLKVMMTHSLLFPFLKNSEVQKWLQRPQGECFKAAEWKPGQGMLLLDDCLAGNVRFIGRNKQQQSVDKQVDISTTNFIQIYDTIGAASTREWYFDPWQIITNVMLFAQSLGLTELIANDCWKQRTYYRVTKNPAVLPKNTVAQYMSEFPHGQEKVLSAADTILQYDAAKHKAQRQLVSKLKVQANPELKYVAFDASERDVQTIPTQNMLNHYYNVIHQQPTEGSVPAKKSLRHDFPLIVFQYPNTSIDRNSRDTTFKNYVIDHALLSVSATQALGNKNKAIINQLVSDLQRNKLDGNIKATLKNYGIPPNYVDELCVNGSIEVEVLHYFMVNPLLIMYANVEDTNACVFSVKIGDAWFLQPILELLESLNVSVVIRRIQDISNFKDMKMSEEYGALEKAIQNTIMGKVEEVENAVQEKYTFTARPKPSVDEVRNMAKRIQDVIYTGPWANQYITFDKQIWRKNQ